jgi:hypothetical protein
MIIGIVLIIKSSYSLKHIHQVNHAVDEANKSLLEKQNRLINENDKLCDHIDNNKKQLEDLQNNISKTLDNQKELSQKAFENYCEILEKQYEEKEKEYDMYEKGLDTAYSNLQFRYLEDLNKCKEELDQIKATRAAALQAKLKEKEIKDKLSFYCLTINNNDLDDIKVLNRMKAQLHNPRILSMLIWKTYFQKPMTELCNNIIGTTTKVGIYKITNQLDDMCYIGQSVDLSTRWKDHAKCGLEIDTPPGNKLYQAMIRDGLWNFSFEILEECSREELNEKEKYYISLYQAKDYGYNSNKGVNNE